jgi:hypothetical protein
LAKKKLGSRLNLSLVRTGEHCPQGRDIQR